MTEELKLLVVPLVAGVMMMVKLVPPLQPESRRWLLPWIATALGVLGAWLVSEPFTRMAALQGLVWGLSAAGLYDVASKPVKAVIAKAKNATAGLFLLLFLCVGLVLVAGCAMPAATIGVLEFEREMLDQDAEMVRAHFQVKRELVESQIGNLWSAAYADIEAHEPPDAAWTITTIKGTRAAAGLLEERILVMMEARSVSLDNIAARQEALDRAAGLVEKSQNWPQDAKLWAAELRDLLEKSRAAP